MVGGGSVAQSVSTERDRFQTLDQEMMDLASTLNEFMDARGQTKDLQKMLSLGGAASTRE